MSARHSIADDNVSDGEVRVGPGRDLNLTATRHLPTLCFSISWQPDDGGVHCDRSLVNANKESGFLENTKGAQHAPSQYN